MRKALDGKHKFVVGFVQYLEIFMKCEALCRVIWLGR